MDITYQDKSPGKSFTPGDANEIKAAVNSKANISDVSPRIESLQALRSYEGLGESVYVQGHTEPGDGGGGVFILYTGAPIGTYIDDDGITIVPAGGNGSSAFVRDDKGATDPRWYGAGLSRSSGVNRAAFQKCVDRLKPWILPEGVWIADSSISVSLGASQDFSVIGYGAEISTIIFETGGFVITLTSQQSTDMTGDKYGIIVRDLSLETQEIGLSSAIKVVSTAVFATPKRGIWTDFSNLTLTGNNHNVTWWKVGIELIELAYIQVNHVRYFGNGATFQGIAVKYTSLDPDGSQGTILNIERLWAERCETGVYIEGHLEGLDVSNSVIIGVQNGVYADITTFDGTPSVDPSLSIQNTHINLSKDNGYAVHSGGYTDVQIDADSNFFLSSGSYGVYLDYPTTTNSFSRLDCHIKGDDGTTNTTGIWISDTADIIAIGATFRLLTTGVDGPATGANILLSDSCQFEQVDTPFTPSSSIFSKLPANRVDLASMASGEDVVIRLAPERTADGSCRIQGTASSGGYDDFRLTRNATANGSLELENKGTGLIKLISNGTTVGQFNASSYRPGVNDSVDFGSTLLRYKDGYLKNLFVGSGSSFLTSSAASPQGVITGTKGCLCIDENAGELYWKSTASGNTGWLVHHNIGNIQELRDYVGGATILYVQGHTSAGDGGAGTFIKLSAGGYVDDNGITIVPTGGDGSTAWVRAYKGAINVDWYGARGLLDSTTAIQSAVKESSTIEFSNTTYYTRQIDITYNNVCLKGNGTTLQLLEDTGAGQQGMFVVSQEAEHVTFDNLWIIGTGSTQTVYDAVELNAGIVIGEGGAGNGAAFARVINCRFTNFISIGVWAKNLGATASKQGAVIANNIFRDFVFDATTAAQAAIVLGNGAEYTVVTKNQTYNVPSGIRVIGGANCTISDNMLTRCNGGILGAPDTSRAILFATQGTNSGKLIIKGNHINHNEVDIYPVLLKGDTTKPQNPFIVSNNDIIANGTATFGVQIRLENAPNSRLIGNSFRAAVPYISPAVEIYGVSPAVSVSKNHIRGGSYAITVQSLGGSYALSEGNIYDDNSFLYQNDVREICGWLVELDGTSAAVGSLSEIPSEWVVTKITTGAYQVVHNFGNTNYMVEVTVDPGAAPGVIAGSARIPHVWHNNNDFRVYIRTDEGASVDPARVLLKVIRGNRYQS